MNFVFTVENSVYTNVIQVLNHPQLLKVYREEKNSFKIKLHRFYINKQTLEDLFVFFLKVFFAVVYYNNHLYD